MKKYLVVIGDGMADLPLKELGHKTPLEVARTPNLDYLAQYGTCGWVSNVPARMEPGSDVAAMSIFGYNPKRDYTGRGPLEAASLGVKLKKDEIAFRCNLVAVENDRMKDFTAGHIKTSDAKKAIQAFNKYLGGKGIKFYTGLSYRHLLVINEKLVGSAVKTVPPHDITGQAIGKYLPQGKGADLLLRLMSESEVLLHKMKSQATMIWPWGQGKQPRMEPFLKKFKAKGAVITAVHLLKGLGKIVGMEIINVPGATGYLDTNYKGKALAALKALKSKDIVFVHVEAPDEAGHEGSITKKIKAIEDFDKLVIGTILSEIRNLLAGRQGSRLEIGVLVLPDHPTPIKYMTHTSAPVPFVMYEAQGIKGPVKAPEGGRRLKAGEAIRGFNEKEIKKSKIKIRKGYELLAKFIGGQW
jgi:2,3-bisphosphoglycerate-independent phosphoglycerate mutase